MTPKFKLKSQQRKRDTVLEFLDGEVRRDWEKLLRDYVRERNAEQERREEARTPSPDAFHLARGKRLLGENKTRKRTLFRTNYVLLKL